MSSSNSSVGSWPRPARLRLAVLATAWLLVLGESPAAADYKESYEAGIEAVRSKKWSEVVRLMQEAIAEQSQAGERIKVYGMRFVPYTPYYYLGLALYEQGDCEGAVDAWETSERQSAISGSRAKKLNEQRDECAQALSPSAVGSTVPPAVSTTPPPGPGVDSETLARVLDAGTKPIDEARELINELEALRMNPDTAVLFEREPALVEVLVTAGEEIHTAQEMLANGKENRDLAVAEEVARRAVLTRDDLEELKGAIAERRQDLTREIEESTERRALRADLGRFLANAARVAAAADRLESDPRLREAREALQDYVRQAESIGDETAVAELIDLRDRLSKAAIALEEAVARTSESSVGDPPPPPRLPAVLRKVAEAFFAADYETALDALRDAELRLPKARAAAHLISGAARYSLFLEGGRQDSELREAAAADISACRELDPQALPTTAHFSPSFIDFFHAIP